MVVPRFVGQALEGKEITVYGDGMQTRCFCHVADLVPALPKLLRCPSAWGEVVNLGGTEEVTINDLAERVRALVNPRVRVVHVPYERAYDEGFEDMTRRVPCIEKARALIGFEPRRSLDAILRDVQRHIAGTAPRKGEG